MWRQGDVIERPGISWLGPAGLDPVTGMTDGQWSYEPVADPDLIVPFGVIASQTCDIGADGPGAKHPFVEIHPVVNMSEVDAGRRSQIERFEMRYLVALTQPPAPGFWVADLRLVLCVSKAQLIGTTALPGFATENDRLAFAEALARKKRRPALHDVLSYDLPKMLNDHVAERNRALRPRDWYLEVEQVRLQVTGDRLGPDTVSLIFVCEVDMPVEHRAEWREASKVLKRRLRSAGFHLGAMTFTTLDKMSGRLYRDTVALDVAALGRPPQW
jgi:hypothetical protein